MVSYITEYCVCPHVVVDIWHFHTIGVQGKKCSFVSHRKAERKKVRTTFNISTFVFFSGKGDLLDFGCSNKFKV